MPSSNILLFDANKANMMSDEQYNTNTQRLNGVQSGIASSQLQNKTLYQVSLVAYAIAQIMNQNGLDANDTAAVSAFVANLSGTMLQKVYDKASQEEANSGIVDNKWISPAKLKAVTTALSQSVDTKLLNYLLKSGGTMTGPLTLSGNPSSPLMAATKQYVDSIQWVQLFTLTPDVKYNTVNISCRIPAGAINLKNVIMIKEVFNFTNFYLKSTSSSTNRIVGFGIIHDGNLEATNTATPQGNVIFEKMNFLNSFIVSKDITNAGYETGLYFKNKVSFPRDDYSKLVFDQKEIELNPDGTNKEELNYLSTDYEFSSNSDPRHTYTLYGAVLSPGL